jgi:hypothetical protein
VSACKKAADEGLSPEAREKYKVVIWEGRLLRTNGQPFPPKSGIFRYVVDAQGQLFMEDARNKASIISHASFIGDHPVRCAGRMIVRMAEDGKARVSSIDNESGHYLPSRDALIKMVAWLNARGVEVKEANYATGGHQLVPLETEYLPHRKA